MCKIIEEVCVNGKKIRKLYGMPIKELYRAYMDCVEMATDEWTYNSLGGEDWRLEAEVILNIQKGEILEVYSYVDWRHSSDRCWSNTDNYSVSIFDFEDERTSVYGNSLENFDDCGEGMEELEKWYYDAYVVECPLELMSFEDLAYSIREYMENENC